MLGFSVELQSVLRRSDQIVPTAEHRTATVNQNVSVQQSSATVKETIVADELRV